MKSTQFFFFSVCINNLECSEYTDDDLAFFFFFSSCFLQHFVRSPVLCHFDPKGGCAPTCDMLMFEFMFQIV